MADHPAFDALFVPQAASPPAPAREQVAPRPLCRAGLEDLRDMLHSPSFTIAGGHEEIGLWLAQLDDAVVSGEIDPRPSWELAAETEAERVAEIVFEKLRSLPARRPRDTETWLTRRQAAERLGCSSRKFDVDVRPHVPAYPVGRTTRFKAQEIDAWLEAQRAGESVRSGASTRYASATRAAGSRSPRARAILARLRG